MAAGKLLPGHVTLQLALSRRFGNFASLRFDVSDQPHVVFHLVGAVQPPRQSARAPPHSMSTGTPQAASRSQAGAPSVVRSSPMDLSLWICPLPLTPWSLGLDGGLSSSRTGPHHPPPPPWFPFVRKGISVARQRLRTPGGTMGRSGGKPR